MQTVGKKNRPTMDNIIIMNAIIEKQRQDHENTCMQIQKNALENSETLI